MMPEMSGPELIQKIRAANQWGYTYILLLTAKDSKDSVLEGLKAGSDDYLTKPFDKDELMARLAIGERILNLEARLAHMATHDGLTGLLNSRAIYDRFQAELERTAAENAETSLIMVDLDHFKTVNDRYGHLVGDEALRQTARVLEQAAPLPDCAGRWGGEEFVLLLPEMNLTEAARLAEALRARIEAIRIAVPGDPMLQFTASLGISVSSLCSDACNLNQLVMQADQAMYQAKSNGRNRVVCYASPAA
jgi:two-component system cell cycle response regulator